MLDRNVFYIDLLQTLVMGEKPSQDTEQEISRRSVMKNMSAAGVAPLLGTLRRGQKTDGKRGKVTDEKLKAQKIEEAKLDDEVAELERFARKKDLVIDFHDADVLRFKREFPGISVESLNQRNANEEYFYLVVANLNEKKRLDKRRNHGPAEVETREDWYLTWADIEPESGSEYHQVQLRKITRKDGDVVEERFYSNQGTAATEDSKSSHTSNNTISKTSTTVLSNNSDHRDNQIVAAEDDCGQGDWKLYCWEWPEVSCILSYSASVIGCSTCAMGSIPSCIACALGGSGWAISGCLNDSCAPVCVDKFDKPYDGAGYVDESEGEVECNSGPDPAGVCSEYGGYG